MREATKAAMDGVPVEIIKRQPAHFDRADRADSLGAAQAVGLSANDLPAAQAAE